MVDLCSSGFRAWVFRESGLAAAKRQSGVEAYRGVEAYSSACLVVSSLQN